MPRILNLKHINSPFRKNLSISFISFFVSIGSAFWLTPFIISNLGVEANGYIGTVTDLLNTATIITLAITAMSSRYISIELQRGNIKQANKYFNSIFISIATLALGLFILFFVAAQNIDKIIQIDATSIDDVRKLLYIVFATFLITFLKTPFLGVLYYRNRLDIIYTFQIVSHIFRVVLSIAVFELYRPMVWVPNLGVLIIEALATLYIVNKNKNLVPELRISLRDFDIKAIKLIVNSGIWVSISKAGTVMLSTLNTYLINIFIGPKQAGIYVSIFLLNSMLVVMVNAIVPSFIPQMFKLYAQRKIPDLVSYVKRSIVILGVPIGIVVGGIIVFGQSFITLWLGKQFGEYELLLIATVIYLPIVLPVELLSQMNITTNNIKTPAIATLIFGAMNLLMIYIFFTFTSLGIFAIPIAQMVSLSIRAAVFFPIYCAKTVGETARTFYPSLTSCLVVAGVTYSVGSLINSLVVPNGWIKLGMSSVMTAVITMAVLFIAFKIYKKRNMKTEEGA